MKPSAFAYHDPETIDEAVTLKSAHGSDATVLAGGLSLMPFIYARVHRPEVLVDINRVTEMQQVVVAGDHVEIGAGVRQRTAETDGGVRTAVPILTEAISYIGHAEIRHRGTVGGSIAFADPATELPTVAVTLGAQMVVAGPSGVRTLPAEEFFVGQKINALEPDEVLVATRWPVPGGSHGYVEVSRRVGDRPMAAAACQLELADDGTVAAAAIGVGNIADRPLRASAAEQLLVGSEPTAELVTEAARTVRDQVTNGDDIHATHDYRKHVAATITARAITAALHRGARGETA
ncbi:FAD binding domain-containing protein [Georgenia sp. Z1491]|uniref:FAD binding domain-containing protein n=1 Tax=Georgenia sp. Z1491 TaxID=3416707 RepID=UPI003CF98650